MDRTCKFNRDENIYYNIILLKVCVLVTKFTEIVLRNCLYI